MSEGQLDLPQGWALTTLGDLVALGKERFDPTQGEDLPYIGLEHIEKDTGRILGHGRSTEVRSTKAMFHAGDVLYGKLRPYLNKVAIPDFDGVCSTDILVFLRSEHTESKFIYYRLLSRDFVQFANENVSGVQHPRTDFRSLSEFNIALPPLAEQRRIVEKLDAFFSGLKTIADTLYTTTKLREQYPTALMRAAIDGELTAAWRKSYYSGTEVALGLLKKIADSKQGRKRRTQVTQDIKMPPVGLSGMPETWTFGTLDAISEQIVDCPHSTPKYGTGDRYCVDTTCIAPGKVIISKLRRVDEETFISRTTKLKPRAGDIIFAREGTVGTATVLPDKPEVCMGQRVMLIRPSTHMNPKFVELSLMSPQIRSQYASEIVGSTVEHVNVRDVVSIVIPVPSREEQDEIVRIASMYLNSLETVNTEVGYVLNSLEQLKQKLFEDAFSGRLTLQDPSDEPASVLIERIQAQRTKAKGRQIKLL